MTGETFRILLVEDNKADVYLFRKALLSAGLDFDLIVMEDGGKAMAFVRGEGDYAGRPVPDLAVIDLSLPKNDGVQVLEAIRADERFADMPVVVASSSAAPPARLKETHLRVARYIHQAARPGGVFADRRGVERHPAGTPRRPCGEVRNGEVLRYGWASDSTLCLSGRERSFFQIERPVFGEHRKSLRGPRLANRFVS